MSGGGADMLGEQPWLATASPNFAHGKNKGEEGHQHHAEDGQRHEQFDQGETLAVAADCG